MRSRILLRNLSRENEGLAVECSASNSDRTTGRTGLKTGQNPRQDRTKSQAGQDKIPGRTGLKTGQDRIRSQAGHQEQDRTEGKPGSQAGQDPSQYRTNQARFSGRTGLKAGQD